MAGLTAGIHEGTDPLSMKYVPPVLFPVMTGQTVEMSAGSLICFHPPAAPRCIKKKEKKIQCSRWMIVIFINLHFTKVEKVME